MAEWETDNHHDARSGDFIFPIYLELLRTKQESNNSYYRISYIFFVDSYSNN